MTAPLPTPGEVEEMRARHRRVSRRIPRCMACEQMWPCDAARLLALAGAQDEPRRFRWRDRLLLAVLQGPVRIGRARDS